MRNYKSKKVLIVTIWYYGNYNDCIDKYIMYKLCTKIQCHMTNTVLNDKLHCLACIHVIVVAKKCKACHCHDPMQHGY